MSERPETKREKFVRLRDARLPKITHAMSILANLGGTAYESSEDERRAVVRELQDAVDNIATEFGVAQAVLSSAPVTDTKPEEVNNTKGVEVYDTDDVHPATIVEGGSQARHEIAWAHDAVMRKDWKLAANRLKRVIDMWRQ